MNRLAITVAAVLFICSTSAVAGSDSLEIRAEGSDQVLARVADSTRVFIADEAAIVIASVPGGALELSVRPVDAGADRLTVLLEVDGRTSSVVVPVRSLPSALTLPGLEGAALAARVRLEVEGLSDAQLVRVRTRPGEGMLLYVNRDARSSQLAAREVTSP